MLFTYNGTTSDCYTAYTGDLTNGWSGLKAAFSADTSINSVMALLGITPQAQPLVQSAVQAAAGASAPAHLSDQVAQTGMLFAFSSAAKSYMGQSDPGTAIQQYTQLEIKNYKNVMIQAGLFAKQLLPQMMIVLQCAFLILTPLFALAIFIPGNMKVIQNILIYTAWVYCWDPVMATISGLVNIGALAKIQAEMAAVNPLGMLNFFAYQTMINDADLSMAIAGGMAMTAPSLALAIVKGGEMAMAGVVGGLMRQVGPADKITQGLASAEQVEGQKDAARALHTTVGELSRHTSKGLTESSYVSGMGFDQSVSEVGINALEEASRFNTVREAKTVQQYHQQGVTEQGLASTTAFNAKVNTGQVERLQADGFAPETLSNAGARTAEVNALQAKREQDGGYSVGEKSDVLAGQSIAQGDIAERKAVAMGLTGPNRLQTAAVAEKMGFSNDADGQKIAHKLDSDNGTDIFSKSLAKYGRLSFDGEVTAGSDGKIMNSVSGKSMDGGSVIEIGKDGMKKGATVSEKTVVGGLTSTTVSDYHGNVLRREQSGILDPHSADVLQQKMSTDPTMKGGASYAKAGAYVDMVSGGDGNLSKVQLSHGDHVDYNSHADERNEVHKGNVYENRTVKNTRNDIESGSQTVDGDKITHDNSTAIARGTHITGTDGVVTYGDDAALQMALKGSGAGEIVTTGTAATQKLNQIEHEKALVNDLSTFASENGVKFDAVEAKGSFGLEAFGLGATTTAATGSKDQVSQNVLAGKYHRGITEAVANRGTGVSEAQARNAFDKTFATEVINGVHQTKTVKETIHDANTKVPHPTPPRSKDGDQY
ncbi:MAG: conjugal transfer protein TraG N-terminal domain-containing protein [Dissulfurispiraceae bacterium]